MIARPAVLAGAALAMAGMALSIAASGSLLPAWPAPEPTAAGRWLVDAASAVPLGDVTLRTGLASALAAVVAAGVIAATIARRGHGAIVSAAATLAIGVVSYGDHLGGARLPDAVAAMLVAAASLAAFGSTLASPSTPPTAQRPIAFAITAACGVCAGLVDHAAFALVPLLIAIERRRESTVWAIGGAAAALIVAIGTGALSPSLLTASASVIGRSWLWPITLLMLSGLVGVAWGARWSWSVAAASSASLLLYAGGAHGSSTLVLPCLLLADGMAALPNIGPRTRNALAMAVVAVSLAEMSLWPRVDTWRLLDWRDAVERAVPAGARIATADNAVASLSAPLFGGRGSGITIGPGAVGGDGARYDLLRGDRAVPGRVTANATSAGGMQTTSTRNALPAGPPVHLSYADLPGVLAHMPAGTVVGIVARIDSDAERERARAALARIGHELPASATVVSAAGVIGGQGLAGMLRVDGDLHVLIGDRVTGAGQRSATDFALRVTDGGVELFARGRSVAVGPRAGVIAFRPGGPQVIAVTDVQEGVAWPVAFRALDLRHGAQ